MLGRPTYLKRRFFARQNDKAAYYLKDHQADQLQNHFFWRVSRSFFMLEFYRIGQQF
jgi:hypothetical protein